MKVVKLKICYLQKIKKSDVMYVLLSGTPGSGKCKLIGTILENFENVIWITTLESSKFVRKKFADKNLWVIDTFTYGEQLSRDKDIYIMNPTNLNEISLAISRIVERVGKNYLLVMNSISGLLIYHTPQKLIHFIRTILGRLEADSSNGIFTLVKDAQNREVEISITMFFPNVVEVEGNLRVVKSAYPLEKNVFKFEEGKDLIMRMLKI